MTISHGLSRRVRQAGRPGPSGPATSTVYVHSTVYLAAHSSPLCVRFHTREAVSCGGCRSPHTEVALPRGVRIWLGRGLLFPVQGCLMHPHSDPCQIHVWETSSKIVVVCILIRSRRRRRRCRRPSVLAIGEIPIWKISGPHSDPC
jgi:hypothetical protein